MCESRHKNRDPPRTGYVRTSSTLHLEWWTILFLFILTRDGPRHFLTDRVRTTTKGTGWVSGIRTRTPEPRQNAPDPNPQSTTFTSVFGCTGHVRSHRGPTPSSSGTFYFWPLSTLLRDGKSCRPSACQEVSTFFIRLQKKARTDPF